MRFKRAPVSIEDETTTVYVPFPCGLRSVTPSDTLGTVDVWLEYDSANSPVRNYFFKILEPDIDGIMDAPTGYTFLGSSELYTLDVLENEPVQKIVHVFYAMESYTPPGDPMGLLDDTV